MDINDDILAVDLVDAGLVPDLAGVEGELAEPSALEKTMLLAGASGDISATLTAAELDEIGTRVVEDYDTDRSDRSTWEAIVKEALRAAAQESKGEKKTYPWPNASNINYPLLTVAAMQFNARAYPAIVKGDEAVNVKVVGKDRGRPQIGPDGQPLVEQGPDGQPSPVWAVRPGGKAARAQRVRDYMNTTIFYRMEDWEQDTDVLLLQLPVVGCVFRKVWYDPATDMQRAALVPALRLLAPKGAKSCATAQRLTEEIPDQYPSDIVAAQRTGRYREVDLFGLYDDGVTTEKLGDFDRNPRMLLEQHRLIDLDEDGLPEPYIVTVDHETRKVLRIEPNFGPDSVQVIGDKVALIKAGQFYVKYDFLPDPNGGFYGLGLGHLLRQVGSVIDTAINQMLDAGHAQVAGGGFVGSGVRLTGSKRSGRLLFEPGEWKTVDVPGNQLREAIVDRTFPGVSPVMFQILEMMLGAAQDISSIKDVITGDASNNGQVGTTLALIEQGLQVFSAIYKRTYRALKAEFGLMFGNIGKYATDETREDYRRVLDDDAADLDADFDASDMDIRPVSDPGSVTRIQKMARAQFLAQFVNLPWVNGQAVTKRMFEAADVEDSDELLVTPPPQQPNPADVAKGAASAARADLDAAKAETERAKTEAQQIETFARAFGAGQEMGLAA